MSYSNSTPRYTLRKIENICSHKTCIQLFIAILFVIAKKVETTKMSTNQRIYNQMWYIHTMEFYLAKKINEVSIHAITWKNPENIMLSKISQIPKDIYIIPFM